MAVFRRLVFAALCAHGVIPVFPHSGSPIEINNDFLPGPFFIDSNTENLPATEAIEKSSQFRMLRRNIARLKTVLRERKNQG